MSVRVADKPELPPVEPTGITLPGVIDKITVEVKVEAPPVAVEVDEVEDDK